MYNQLLYDNELRSTSTCIQNSVLRDNKPIEVKKSECVQRSVDGTPWHFYPCKSVFDENETFAKCSKLEKYKCATMCLIETAELQNATKSISKEIVMRAAGR